MLQGTAIDELIQMVERAEQHAVELYDEQEAGTLDYQAGRNQELLGVA